MALMLPDLPHVNPVFSCFLKNIISLSSCVHRAATNPLPRKEYINERETAKEKVLSAGDCGDRQEIGFSISNILNKQI